MITKDRITSEQRRKLFFIFSAIGFDDEARHDFIEDFTEGATRSLAEVDFITARNMIRHLEELRRKPQTRKQDDGLDRKRKGVLKSIYVYLNNRGVESPSMDYVKGIAIRAAGMVPTGMVSHDFNRISSEALTRIYNEFCAKQTVQKAKPEIYISLN